HLFYSSRVPPLHCLSFVRRFQIAAHGDAVSLAIRDACIEVWAAGPVSMLHAYDPEVLILGGGVMNSAQEILPAMSEYIDRHAWTPWGKVMIRAATLMDRASLIGADDRCTQTSDRKSTRLNSSHGSISYAVFCLKKK